MSKRLGNKNIAEKTLLQILREMARRRFRPRDDSMI